MFGKDIPVLGMESNEHTISSKQSFKDVTVSPVKGNGCTYSISRGFTSTHNGLDIAINEGCNIFSVANGEVAYAGWGNGGQGYYVSIKHENGYYSNYLHGNGIIYVKKGDIVNAGSSIMQSGNSGNSTGAHLHFELWDDVPWKYGYPNSKGSLDPSFFIDY